MQKNSFANSDSGRKWRGTPKISAKHSQFCINASRPTRPRRIVKDHGNFRLKCSLPVCQSVCIGGWRLEILSIALPLATRKSFQSFDCTLLSASENISISPSTRNIFHLGTVPAYGAKTGHEAPFTCLNNFSLGFHSLYN